MDFSLTLSTQHSWNDYVSMFSFTTESIHGSLGLSPTLAVSTRRQCRLVKGTVVVNPLSMALLFRASIPGK